MKTILIVEDDEDISEILQQVLESFALRVEPAGNGRIALDYLRGTSELPSMILLDLMMPVMDGQEFLKEKAKDARFALIPTIVMSAQDEIENPPENAGIVEFIQKPTDIDTLIRAIKRYCPSC